MANIIRSRQSEQDVVEIALYIARDNPDAAMRLIDRMDEALHMLAGNPQLGRERHELGSAVRSFALGNYVLFYRQAAQDIELIRVLHGARDLRAIFKRKI
jgi:toxin ParE1/3/4